MRGKILEVNHDGKALNIMKALASEPRLQILELLNNQDMNMNEISEKLNMPAPSVTVNIKKLEDAGLIEVEYQPGSHGSQKICRRTYDSLLVRFPGSNIVESNLIEVSMPIGNYKDFKVNPTCGLATEDNYIGFLDDPQSFLEPEHIYAQLLWFKEGYVKYRFPNNIPVNTFVKKLGLSLEICSEYPEKNEQWPSDVTIWINDIEIGTWTSPGDFGKVRGRLNPEWWHIDQTQYGLLKIWTIKEDGSYIDGKKISIIKIDDLNIENNNFVDVKIGVKANARNIGGINIFGRKFGNYEQDIILRFQYEYND